MEFVERMRRAQLAFRRINEMGRKFERSRQFVLKPHPSLRSPLKDERMPGEGVMGLVEQIGDHRFNEIGRLIERAKRLALKPIEERISIDKPDLKLLASIAIANPNTEQSEQSVMWSCGLNQLIDELLILLPQSDVELICRLYANSIEVEDAHDCKFDFCSPLINNRALFFDLIFQLAEKAVLNGWITVIAEDFGRFSWVPPERFCALRYDMVAQDYSLPNAYWSSCDSLCSKFDEFLGAYHVWYVLSKELLSVSCSQKSDEFDSGRDFAENVIPDQPEWLAVAARLAESQYPSKSQFICQVVALVIEENFSCKAAAERVVDENKHSARGASYRTGTVVGGTRENAAENLYRPAGKIINELKKNGLVPS